MFSDEQKLAHVRQSPVLCAAHDRAGWLNLFAADAEVNDPIGSRPHAGREAIERFYDTFIAPNHLAFDVAHDIVCGMTVMRDLHIESTMSTGVRLSVPMHLRYELVDEGGRLKIRRLYAHWELGAMLRQQMGSLNGLWTSFLQTPRLLRHQGFGGLFGFFRGLLGHGRAGKATAATFLSALAAGNVAAAGAFLEEGASIELPPGTTVTLEQLAGGTRAVRWQKMIGAGNFASASLQLGSRPGVALFRFDRGPQKVSALQLFV